MTRSDESFSEGVEHLQAAANEMIEAARTFLNVVEEVVSDRDKMAAAAGGLTELLTTASGTLSGLFERATRPSPNGGEESSGARSVRRIVIDDDGDFGDDDDLDDAGEDVG